MDFKLLHHTSDRPTNWVIKSVPKETLFCGGINSLDTSVSHCLSYKSFQLKFIMLDDCFLGFLHAA